MKYTKMNEKKFTRYITVQYLNKIRVLQILINIIYLNIISKNIPMNGKRTVLVIQEFSQKIKDSVDLSDPSLSNDLVGICKDMLD